MTALFGAMDITFYVAIAVLLIRKYRRTRDTGLLWLGLPLAIIPFTALPITSWRHAMADRLAMGQPVNCFPFTLVGQGRFTLGELLTLLNYADHVVWGVFALIAVCALSSGRSFTPPRKMPRRQTKQKKLPRAYGTE